MNFLNSFHGSVAWFNMAEFSAQGLTQLNQYLDQGCYLIERFLSSSILIHIIGKYHFVAVPGLRSSFSYWLLISDYSQLLENAHHSLLQGPLHSNEICFFKVRKRISATLNL